MDSLTKAGSISLPMTYRDELFLLLNTICYHHSAFWATPSSISFKPCLNPITFTKQLALLVRATVTVGLCHDLQKWIVPPGVVGSPTTVGCCTLSIWARTQRPKEPDFTWSWQISNQLAAALFCRSGAAGDRLGLRHHATVYSAATNSV